MDPSSIKVAILMADYGHDPTETAVPFTAFKNAGYSISIITENGAVPGCDKKMLEGWTQKLLGAPSSAVAAYEAMTQTPEWNKPLSWSTPNFSLNPYTLVFLPGGHEKGVRQVIDTPIVQSALAAYFPLTRKPSSKVCSAICHGVMLLACATPGISADAPKEEITVGEEGEILGLGGTGKSVLHDVTTTALPAWMETSVYQGTKLVLGDYYKTYGPGSENVEDFVRRRLDNQATQWKSSVAMTPFTVKDDKYNYISARFPPDAQMLADDTIALIKQVTS